MVRRFTIVTIFGEESDGEDIVAERIYNTSVCDADNILVLDLDLYCRK